MSEYRHSGIGFPNGPADVTRVLALPSPDVLMLNSEHWYYDRAVASDKRVLWRGIAREGLRPAEVGYDASRYAAEALRHVNDVSRPIGAFIGWNELDLNYERGDDAGDYDDLPGRYAVLGSFLVRLLPRLREGLPAGCRLHFGAWTPDHGALTWVDSWRQAAEACDVVDFHAYDSLASIQKQYAAYRSAFPNKPLALTEWHCRGMLSEEEAVLQWLANTMADDPLFDAAYFFIWRWHNAPGWWSDSWDIEHDAARHDLFLDPPVAHQEPAPMSSDPWQHFTPETLADAAECPLENVREHWPRIVGQLDLCGINDRPVQVAVAGTVAKESASTFAPVREAFWLPEDERWAEYARRNYGGGPEYHGRGFIQLTHRSNYEAYAAKLRALWGPDAPDIAANPDLALDPDVAAAVTALYFRDTRALPTASWPQGYSLIDAAHARDWEWVRRLVYGGRDQDGEQRLARVAAALEGESVVTFNRDEPAHPQDKSFDCSQEALEWALWSLGRRPTDSWLEQTMLAEGVMSPQLGLLDATGAGLAAFVGRHYGPDGFYANHEPSVSFDWAAHEGDHKYPVLLGGRHFGPGGHWVGVRGYDAGRDLLLLANPADGYDGISQTMSREQFDARGPWSAVRVLHSDLLTGAPAAPEPPTPDPTLARIRALTEEIAALMAEVRAKVDELADLAA